MLSQKLKALRHSRDISQATLAELLNVSQQTVARWEKDLAYPAIKTLLQLAQYFNVSTDFLLDNDESQNVTVITNDEELKLLQIYREIDDSEKPTFMAVANKFRPPPKPQKSSERLSIFPTISRTKKTKK